MSAVLSTRYGPSAARSVDRSDELHNLRLPCWYSLGVSVDSEKLVALRDVEHCIIMIHVER